MPTLPDRRARSRAAGVLLATGLGLGTVLGTALPAAAHDRLESSDPVDGATLATAPDHVDLVMTSAPLDLGTQVQVTGPAGVVSVGEVSVLDRTVTQALGPDRPAGTYEVQWRITSGDGHPISGSLRFTAEAGTPAPASDPSPDASASSTPAAAAPTPAAPAQEPVSATTEGDSPLIAAGFVLLAVIALVGVVIGIRRGRGGS